MSTMADPYRLPVDPVGRFSPGWWAMVLVIATEAMFFVYLLFGYLYLDSLARGAWPPEGPPRLTLAAPNTVLLLASSGTAWWAEREIARGAIGRFRIGLLVTFILGASFLGIQGLEYARERFTPSSHAYGSLFFTITGFHAAHLAVGLLMLLVVQLRAAFGHFDARRHLAVANVTMYWHFVDAVWVVVFTTLYLLPNLG